MKATKAIFTVALFGLVLLTGTSGYALSGTVGNVEYAADTERGLQFVKICAEHAEPTGVFWRFFITNDSHMGVFLSARGDQAYGVGPVAQVEFKRWMRQWVKLMNKVFGPPCSVTLKESDGTTVGEAKTGILGGEIKVKFY